MPHLQLDINRALTEDIRQPLSAALQERFANIMATGTAHIAISLREHATHALNLGRVRDPSAGIAFINADIRRGRSLEQRRSLAIAFVDIVERHLDIPRAHVYVTFTEHKGEDFHLDECYLGDWEAGEGES